MPASAPLLRLTREQVREIDRRCVEEYHIPSIVLMENAARGAADVAMQMMGASNAPVVIVCGSGNNGGDGFAIARHLHNYGAAVNIVFATDRFSGDALINWNIVQAMRLRISHADSAVDQINARSTDLVIDALFGTGLSRPPEGVPATLIDLMNRSGRPILSIDVPSGLDCQTGKPLGVCVRATQTVTFVAEKTGFETPTAKTYLGKITVADIGCPRELIEAVSST